MKAIGPKIAYEKRIADIIRKWQYEVVYKPALDILDKRVVLNDSQIIYHAIQSGVIWYSKGAFYSNTGRFPNNIALELEKLGAKYSKARRCYRITKGQLSPALLWYIEEQKVKTLAKIALINKLWEGVEANIVKELNKIVLEKAVETIFYDLQARIDKNYKESKIEVISPKLTDARAKEISENYINNLKFWIKEWEPEQITKMREAVAVMAIEGKSQKSIANYIQTQFNVTDKNKAVFLARNETAIATASYLKAKYQEDGFNYFTWNTIMDGRERDLHKELGQKENNKYGINGTNIFAFNDPPVIYENKKKGIVQRGIPGERQKQ